MKISYGFIYGILFVFFFFTLDTYLAVSTKTIKM